MHEIQGFPASIPFCNKMPQRDSRCLQLIAFQIKCSQHIKHLLNWKLAHWFKTHLSIHLPKSKILKLTADIET